MSKSDTFGLGAGAAATTVAYAPPVNNMEPDFDREEMEDQETVGNRAPQSVEYGGRIYKPSGNLSVRPNSIGLVLASFLGPPTTTQPDAVNAPTVYQHVFDPVAAGVSPLAVAAWLRYADLDEDEFGNPVPAVIDKFEEGIGNEITLSCEANNYFKAETEWFFKRLITNAADPSMTKDAGRKFPFSKVGVEFAAIGGVYAATSARSFSWQFSNELEDDQFVLGSLEVDSIPPGPEITSQLKFRPTQDIAAHNRRALANEPESMKMRVTATGPLIATTFNYSLAIELHKLQTMQAPVKLDGSETLRDAEVTARPVEDEATGKFVTVTLVNTEDGTKYR